MVEFEKRVLLLGCGAVGQCTLPLLFRQIKVPCANVTVMDFEDKSLATREWTERGVTFVQNRVTPENLGALLAGIWVKATCSSIWPGTSTAANSCSGATTMACST